MLFLIPLIGCGLVALALIHAVFPKVFDWKRELPLLSLVNRQLMTVHTFFIALMVFLMGLLFVSSAELLLYSALGRKILWGLSFFWLARLITQLFGYSPKLWQGKHLETLVHIVFIFLWSAMTVIFALGAMT
ncbi:hypothetical protein [Rubritalea profundi]|uniref:Uncharacterized protein n=1 Tax=Rubritalea profundi TaxID=1658618 RepID=A0A2S7U1Z2_9BACT|nr:hypothetical protein [Rubritalea profundi]PQJ29009.1 hypothetical protein BSZ32_11255 [Rubritalea profundi]